MIVSPENMTFAEKKFSMILYGSPGVGKTTLALSAPNPILLDFDRGVSRVNAAHRRDTSICSSYEEVLEDVHSPAMAHYETVVIDTGGSFITFLQDWAMRSDPKVNQQKNGTISLKGYGAVKNEFSRFTNYIKDTLHKNLIYVFHSVESSDKDGNPVQRLMCEGAAKNTVWTPCDFGGYVQMIGNARNICFTPEQEFFAKGCHGISGHIVIPTLTEGVPNDFLTRLFAQARANITKEREDFAPIRAGYDALMEQARGVLARVTDAETATKAAEQISSMDHVLTSRKECAALLAEKAKELGLRWNADQKRYEAERS